MRRSQGVGRRGRCYENAFLFLEGVARQQPGARLCHGIVRQTGEPEVWMGHAWVELGGVVFDPTGLGVSPIPKDQYYRVGHVQYVVRYTLAEARQMVVRYELYGPWDSRVAAAAHGDDDERKAAANVRQG